MPISAFCLFSLLTVVRGMCVNFRPKGNGRGRCAQGCGSRVPRPGSSPSPVPASSGSPIFQRRIPLKVTLGRFRASASIALGVSVALGFSPALAEPLSNKPAGLEAGDDVRSVGIYTVVGSERFPNGATVATILESSASGLWKSALLDLVDHSCGGSATPFDALWTASATELRAVDPGHLGGNAAVLSRSSSARSPWSPTGGAEAAVSTKSPRSGVSR